MTTLQRAPDSALGQTQGTVTIAVAGKGGTGKTTIAALLIQMLSQKGIVLAVDADPSCNLNLALGLPLAETVGDVREDTLGQIKQGSFAAGVPKQDYIQLKIAEALVESDRVDLIAMGRPEGAGCYCAANYLVRSCVDQMAKHYPYVVIDNEAGLEHLSRQTTQDVDYLIIVSDPIVRGITVAGRVKELVGELQTQVNHMGLVVNRVNGQLTPEVEAAIERYDLELWGQVPQDSQVADLDGQGKAITELAADAPARRAVEALLVRLGL